MFHDKNVLVTGGGSGIGLGIAKAFADHGAHVFITGRNKERLKTAIDGLLDKREYVEGHAFDVRDRETVDQIADMLAEDYGPMDVVVNNAAGNFVAPFAMMSGNAWDSVIDIVLQGTRNITHTFGRHMMRDAMANGPKDRSFVNVVAGYAWTGAAGVSHSGAAKAAVLNLTKSIAVEWAHYGIRSNAISPGPIERTGGAEKLWEGAEGLPDIQETVLQTVPLGRFGTPEEMGLSALFLASPAATYVTGTCLVADGGTDALGPFPFMAQMLAKHQKPAPS
ncbi:MAG: SDR family oxidoreductase [Euryarchaeota archaeon]|nr:SDR family oxidoreductase [Euryarchaeota archaeon]